MFTVHLFRSFKSFVFSARFATLRLKKKMSHALAGEERSAALAKIPGWADVDGRDAIRKVYRFKGNHQVPTNELPNPNI